MADGQNLRRARTSEILPVDLNSIMYRFETNLQQLHAMSGDSLSAMQYAAAARKRQQAMAQLMWSDSRRQWIDFHWPTSQPLTSAPTSSSNWLPLWAGAFDERQGKLAVQSLRHSDILQIGGVATTAARTEHQWDWPNAWAPLQVNKRESIDTCQHTHAPHCLAGLPPFFLSVAHPPSSLCTIPTHSQEMLIEGLENTQRPEAHDLALRIARAWTSSNFKAWRRTHYMYEKYSATDEGVGGGGGEYTPQVGFGWSNGVALSLLSRYGDELAV